MRWQRRVLAFLVTLLAAWPRPFSALFPVPSEQITMFFGMMGPSSPFGGSYCQIATSSLIGNFRFQLCVCTPVAFLGQAEIAMAGLGAIAVRFGRRLGGFCDLYTGFLGHSYFPSKAPPSIGDCGWSIFRRRQIER